MPFSKVVKRLPEIREKNTIARAQFSLVEPIVPWIDDMAHIHPSISPSHIHPFIHLKKRRKKGKRKTIQKPTARLSLSLSLARLSLPPRNPRRHYLRRSIPACSGGPRRRAAKIRAPLPPLFPSLRPDPPLVAPRAHPRPLPMARVSRVASPPTPARRWRLCSTLSNAHRKSHGRLRLVDGAPAPGGCGADARGG